MKATKEEYDMLMKHIKAKYNIDVIEGKLPSSDELIPMILLQDKDGNNNVIIINKEEE